MSSVFGRSTIVVLSLIAVSALSRQVAAQEPQASSDAPAVADVPAAAAPEGGGVVVGGFVDAYYGYNFNKTDPSLRTFDVQHNAVSLSLAELNLSKVPRADSRVGFRLDLDFGKTAELTSAFEPSESDRVVYEHVQQAYLSLLTGKVQWDAGKFVTPIGAEVIESQDNWNYTRSILFGYAIPFYHLGVRAALPVSDKLTLTGFLTNGWNNASELDGDKTFALSMALTPIEKVTWIANYMVGKEAPDSAETRDLRHLFDTTLTVNATDKLSLMANFDYGAEGPVRWWGIAAYAKYQVVPSWALAGRYEYVDDSKGGFMTIGQKAQSLTVTSDHLLAGALKARLEYRLDLADDFFTKSDGTKTGSQSTVTAGLVYVFAGKI
jgi:hypothetical protein